MLSGNSRRIAKNTGFLYIRMLLMMGVAFYTSRIVLNALGVEDYGIYNVVGGVVAMFSFLTGSFSACTQRFLNYEMGLGNEEGLQKVFSMSITINALICVLLVFIMEPLGVWFINHKLIIPPDRLNTAFWVFQFSLIATLVTVMSTPYNAVIIAHEQMNVFAYITILEVLLKLGVALVIAFFTSDKLISYAFLILLVSLVIRMAYLIYCKRVFRECHYQWFWDIDLFRRMGGFAGWNLYGNFSFVMLTQGLNILLNMFFGPGVNTARAIAVQVQSAVQGFATNFMLATNPRIVQNYAQGNRKGMYKLVFFSAKFSFFLLLVLIVPILLETETLLKIWLKQVPEYSVIFVRLILIQTLIWVLHAPLHSAIHASGKMKKYQLVTGTLSLVNLPVSYLILYEGGSPPSVLVVSIMIFFIMIFALLLVLKGIMDFPMWSFVMKVLLPLSCTCAIIMVTIMPVFYFTIDWPLYSRLIIRVVLTVLMSVAVILGVGMNQEERMMLKKSVHILIDKFRFNQNKY